MDVPLRQGTVDSAAVQPPPMNESDLARGPDAPHRGVDLERRPWRRTPSTAVKGPITYYRSVVLVSDGMALVVSSVVAFSARYAFFPGRAFSESVVALSAVAVACLWLAALAASGSYDTRVFGSGSEEYRRVLTSSGLVLAAVATVSYLLNLDTSRGLVVLEIPLGTCLLILGRYICRRQLRAWRRSGEALSRAMVVGDETRVRAMRATVERDPASGLAVVASMPPPSDDEDLDRWADELHDVAVAETVHAVALTSHPAINRHVVRAVGWRLEGPGMDLLVTPEFVDIGGPRITVRQADDMPLIHLDEPRLRGPRRVAKRAMDIVGAATTLLVLAPVMLMAALGVRLGGNGPVFFRQTRIGERGAEFGLWKFRTMRVGAHLQQSDVWSQGSASGTSNKAKHDPRVTRVGGLLRRWSIDELPQLFNVLAGEMSLVGPRPLQPVEVDELPDEHDRRHLTKPGMTGLWQVSGRSDVTWEERMRLDLRYVEQWSISLDLVILVKTVKAVLTRAGAY